ncbi:G-protein beta WD-40 repeats containing protein [Reticulomyxa filosa]|uniref:G-protein beta WD-40 repeats containing protein n=1 Tax=Reticulomyxa filosa TaxID=46433 RepID=X6P223_RETFI|nr:G-protein beta WD-40 repeats containing protein [Reticulomyxa filosa]|eukprot:ETO32271.1 G-protein beta WD-40 repeats containing protein [Reticulomyxa filosa]
MILTNLCSIMLCFFVFTTPQLNVQILFVDIINYHYLTQATTFFTLDIFRLSSKLIKTFTTHTDTVQSIDYSTFDDRQFICSGSDDKTVRLWDIEKNKQIQVFNRHSGPVYCVKFSPYHYHSNRRHVICSSSEDETIRFWDIKDNKQLQVFNKHTYSVYGMEFSPFAGGRYLCSGSADITICLWDVETSKSLHVFNGHKKTIWCVDISPLRSNNNSNSIGVIGGNGYTICSGSCDKTIRIWDIETTKQSHILIGHRDEVCCVKYGSSELRISGGVNTILSGSKDRNVCLWDVRSGRRIQEFIGHTSSVTCVEYSPFVVNNIDIGGYSNVICSGSLDNTIRFWDVRSRKKELFVVKGDAEEDDGIICLTFLGLKKKVQWRNIFSPIKKQKFFQECLFSLNIKFILLSSDESLLKEISKSFFLFFKQYTFKSSIIYRKSLEDVKFETKKKKICVFVCSLFLLFKPFLFYWSFLERVTRSYYI